MSKTAFRPTLAELPDTMTLGEARQIFASKLDEGLYCPLCAQAACRRSRPLNASMAFSLVALCKLYKIRRRWLTSKELTTFMKGEKGNARVSHPSGSLATLRFWGLISSEKNPRRGKKCYGPWKPTRRGIEFVLGRIQVPARVIIYNNRCEGFEGDDVSIGDALATAFDIDDQLVLGLRFRKAEEQ